MKKAFGWGMLIGLIVVGAGFGYELLVHQNYGVFGGLVAGVVFMLFVFGASELAFGY